MMKDFIMDDKTLVIISTLALGMSVIFAPALTPDKAEIIKLIFAGLFGISVGRTTK